MNQSISAKPVVVGWPQAAHCTGASRNAARRDGQGCRTAGTDRQGIRLRKESGSAFKAELIFGQAEFRWVSGRSLVKTYEAVCYQGCCALAAPVSRSLARRNDALVGNSCFREGKLPPRRHEVPSTLIIARAAIAASASEMTPIALRQGHRHALDRFDLRSRSRRVHCHQHRDRKHRYGPASAPGPQDAKGG